MRLPPITGILCSTLGQPVAVPDAAMALIESKFDERDLFIPELPPSSPNRVGRMFSVQVGPWARFLGQCVSESPRGRVSLLMTIFGRSTVVEFPDAKIAEVG